jgi:curli biogenesis system outer membrane secretion channel CsgG
MKTFISKLTIAVMVQCLLVLSFAPLKADASVKRRIAILPFDYGAVSTEVGTYDVGKGVTTLLITKLVNDGTYSVVDRQMLDSILKEQNLSVSDRADPATACKIGKILSVDAIIVGTVTQFGFETKSVSAGGLSGLAGFIPYAGGYAGMGLGSTGVRKSKVRVGIDARIIDINTTEILAAVHGAGESKRTGTQLLGGLAGDWDSSGFATSIAGEATLQAVDAIGNQLIAMASKIPDNQSIAAANVVGKVADVTGNQVIVNIGKVNGITSGDNLRVEHAYKTVLDPTTGKVLKELSNTIAVVTVSDVDTNSSTGTVTKGSGVKVGDSVSKVTTEVSGIIVSPPPGTTSTPAAPAATATPTSTGAKSATTTTKTKTTVSVTAAKKKTN